MSEPLRKLKLWGGMHGNEAVGINVVADIVQNPINGIDVEIGNVLASARGQRFLESNLVFEFPGDPGAANYETRRAAEIIASSKGYDGGVIDLHCVNDGESGCEFVGMSDKQAVSPELLGFALHTMGIGRAVLLYGHGLPHHVPNSMLFEVPERDKLADVNLWRAKLGEYVLSKELPTAKSTDFEWYRYTHGVYASVYSPDELTDSPEPFTPLPDKLQDILGLEGRGVWFGAAYPPSAEHLKQTRGCWAECGVPIEAPHAA